jgi:hypothetical protein
MCGLPNRVETAYTIGYHKGRVYINQVDVLVVVCAYSCVHISPVCSSDCVSAEACHWGVILSCVGHEEVIKYDVDGGAAIYDSEMATRLVLQFVCEHVAAVLPGVSAGQGPGSHFQELVLLFEFLVSGSSCISWFWQLDMLPT